MECARCGRLMCALLALGLAGCGRTASSTERTESVGTSGTDATSGAGGNGGAGGADGASDSAAPGVSDGGTSGVSDGGTSGVSDGGTSGVSDGGTSGGDGYSLFVNATTISTMTEYTDVVATRRNVANGTEISIVGTVADEAGREGYLRLYLAPNPVPGTYACSDSVYVTTLQLCCPYAYDSRNQPTDPDCWITLSEVGSGAGRDVAGTFNAITHDEFGGRLFLRDGHFRVRLEN